jgi:hypothetical protein
MFTEDEKKALVESGKISSYKTSKALAHLNKPKVFGWFEKQFEKLTYPSSKSKEKAPRTKKTEDTKKNQQKTQVVGIQSKLPTELESKENIQITPIIESQVEQQKTPDIKQPETQVMLETKENHIPTPPTKHQIVKKGTAQKEIADVKKTTIQPGVDKNISSKKSQGSSEKPSVQTEVELNKSFSTLRQHFEDDGKHYRPIAAHNKNESRFENLETHGIATIVPIEGSENTLLKITGKDQHVMEETFINTVKWMIQKNPDVKFEIPEGTAQAQETKIRVLLAGIPGRRISPPDNQQDFLAKNPLAQASFEQEKYVTKPEQHNGV